MNKFYTGIGHQTCTEEAREFIGWLASNMAERGYTLISGDAKGVDTYFRENSNGDYLVYLPDMSYNHYEGRDPERCVILTELEIELAELELYRTGIVPDIYEMSEDARKFMRRNYFQSWNQGKRPEFCFYYAKEASGEIVGNTRIAVETARELGIPTFNIYTPEGRNQVRDLLNDR